MHVLAFANQKGGCGKTTTAVHLAGALVAAGERVLLADLDPQAHATLALSCSRDDGPGLVGVLEGWSAAVEARRRMPGGIDLLPGCAELSEFEERAARRIRPEQALARAVAGCEDAYDFVLLDCPPRVDGVLCANAFQACDTVVLVVESGAFALQGALEARRIFAEKAEQRERPFALKVLATLFDRRLRIARDLLVATQARFGPELFDAVVHTSVRLREAAAFGVPVQELDPRCRAARDFDALATEVREHARRHRPTRVLRPRPAPEASPAPSASAPVPEEERLRR